MGKREPTENNTEITQILEHWVNYLTKTLKQVKKKCSTRSNTLETNGKLESHSKNKKKPTKYKEPSNENFRTKNAITEIEKYTGQT